MTTNFIVGGEGDLDANRYLYSYEDYLIDDVANPSGRLWMWGDNSYGQLGNNEVVEKSVPIQTISAGTNWKFVAGSVGGHTAAIKTDGTLWLWGANYSSGELGTNTNQDPKSSPVQTVTGGTNWKQVSVSYARSAAVKTDGTLWLWGSGYDGVLGDNTNGINRSSPVQTVSGGTNWKSVDVRGVATCAIKTDGTLWLWGTNWGGQIGDNTRTNRSSPVQTVAGGTNWKMATGGASGHTVAIKTDGTLWGWGNNDSGQLGTGEYTNRSSPVQTVAGGSNWKQVSCGDYHTVAIKTDGTLWGWGYNGTGEIGTNSVTIVYHSSPVQTIAGGTNWKQVSCGYYHTAAVKTDGTLWLWGSNFIGQLGDNTSVSKSSPVQTAAGGRDWRAVDCGGSFTGATTY